MYADSVYDELEDLLYNEGDPDVAGDLAEHTLYSPVYQDDPGWDMVNGCSDWEYYSDDYYDDDPALLENNPRDGTPPRPKNLSVQKRRKRKLEETEDIPVVRLDERNTLERCVRGTVWAGPSSEPVLHYKVGQAEKVALLKNWKDVFRTKRGNSKARSKKLRRDESWANDLSLEDMGLRHEKSMKATNGDLLNDHGTTEDTEDADGGDEGYEEGDSEVSENIATLGDSTEIEPSPRKRREQRASTSLSPTPTDASSTTEGPGDSQKGKLLPSYRRSRSGQQANAMSLRHGRISHLSPDDIAAPTSKRKRKASHVEVTVQQTGEDDVKLSEASRKRIVSGKLSTKAPRKQEKQPPLPTQRVTRSRKQ